MSKNVFDLGDYRDQGSDESEPDIDQLSKADIEQSDNLKPFELPEKVNNIWDRIGPYLVKENRLKALFVDVFYEYCYLRVALEEARSFLDDNEWDYVVTGRNGEQIKFRPQVGQYNDDWRKWKSLVAELGLGPSSEKSMSNIGGVQTDLFNDL